jgi:hypothetical protein
MDATAITALVALTGAAIGGLTTVLASWLMQKTQSRAAQWFAQDKLHRQEVYKEFIEGAFERLHQRPPARQGGHSRPGRPLCKNRPDARPVLAEGRRIRGTDRVGNSRYVSDADKSFLELREMVNSGSIDFIGAFSEACRVESRRFALKQGARVA